MSPARLERLLTGHDLRFGAEDGQLIVPTLNALYFWNLENPNILQVRAQWRGRAEDSDSFEALVEAVARCNSTRSGPKAYLLPFQDGTSYGLSAECNVITSAGLTQEQMDTFCETSLEMIMSFFTELETLNPQMVTWQDGGAG
ncbi:YbjN domain-containing protein [Schaalia sp. 19OD2882]|uniref:YbjN domain-containing protein n=1 Tax=Schaalia sp. 19OD2882 TaxID=2794089 RepID=UPI0020A7D54E|nr:YbjN domain-containing protein [Schaalia sp. 19OD2882]